MLTSITSITGMGTKKSKALSIICPSTTRSIWFGSVDITSYGISGEDSDKVGYDLNFSMQLGGRPIAYEIVDKKL